MNDMNEKSLSEKFKSMNEVLTQNLKNYFKYPGSVYPCEYMSEKSYERYGIDDIGEIEQLVDADIWPSAVGGSRSQGNMSVSTNFSLGSFVNSGFTAVKDLLYFRDNNLTCHWLAGMVRYVKKQGYEEKLADLSAEDFVNFRNQAFGEPKEPVKCKFDAGLCMSMRPELASVIDDYLLSS